MTYEEYIRSAAVSEEELDVFLSPTEESVVQFNSELGYILGNYMPLNGMDGSFTISTAQKNGARTSTIYKDLPCRINTYGNSFTECHQVSDHETWQEYLAAHLGEPIRNFGVGGYGVYQAYQRMIRTESTENEAEYIIVYIWGDDHYRSLLRCRFMLYLEWYHKYKSGGRMFHGNFWPNLEMDLKSGQFIQKDNPLPTPEMLHKMTDADFMVDALRDDLMLQMSLFCEGKTQGIDNTRINRLADCLQCPSIIGSSSDEIANQVEKIRTAYAFAATKHIIDRTVEFVTGRNKKVMFVLFCPGATRQLITAGKRYDQPIVEYLQQHGLRYFDMNLIHAEEYKSFNLSLDEYMNRYLIGHYNPKGNHFFAFAIKDEIIDWLNPKPFTYRGNDKTRIDFLQEGYLPETWRL